MGLTFTTTIAQADGMNATGIVVPDDAIAQLGSGKRPKVVANVSGYEYRTTVAPMGTVFMIPFAKEHRDASGISGGDTVTVTLELDIAPRTVDLPGDLAAALDAHPGARERFEKQAYSVRKEHVRQVETAKAQETRERRIASIVAKLAG